MTAAQISRAAAQAVRASTLQDALYIVQSLRYSLATPSEKEQVYELEEIYRTTRRSPLDTHIPFQPIDFGQQVSPRLAAHSLLHSLLRQGRSYEAAKYAELFMKQGVRLRPHTLHATVKALCDSDKTVWNPSLTLASFRGLGNRQVLSKHPVPNTYTATAAAARILLHARKYGQERLECSYDALVRACIIQGEILIAALLFALLVKDWQVRSACQLAEVEGKATGDAAVGDEHLGPAIHSEQVRRSLNIDNLLRRTVKHGEDYLPQTFFLKAPFPSVGLLKQITGGIEAALLERAGYEDSSELLQEPLQALAVLAMLVEEGDIHFGKLSPLIRALYMVPKTEHRIWKHQAGTPVQLNAHTYFHGLLSKMVKSLKDPSLMKLPELDSRACNSLLHYTLRHRLSPSLASAVLEHMVVDRGLSPSPATINVLIRSGTVLRRKDISETALRILRRLNGRDPDAPVDLQPRVAFRGSRKRNIRVGSSFDKAQSRLREESISFPKEMLVRKGQVQADEATIVSFVVHLTSTGKPEVISTVLFDILPELTTVDHPSWGHLSPEERIVDLDGTREESVKRGVTLGPHFLTAVLNALAKTGKTGLAERLWLFAKTAERASWIEGFCPGTEPWCLPVSAYTSMMTCYANEGRKGLPLRKVAEDGQVMWVPRTNNYVRGWARLVFRTQRAEGGESKHWKRFRAARTMARNLLRSMLSGTSAVLRSLLNLEETMDAVNAKIVGPLPTPDARFFNAALKVFRPLPTMLPRRLRTTRSRIRRFLRWAHAVYGRHGRRSEHWDILLQEIAEAMINAGYSVPPAFRHLFIGRYGPGVAGFRQPIPLDYSPFSYPRPRYPFRPYALPTSKKRGLPIRRSHPGQRKDHTHEEPTADTNVPSSP
ncbi:hypothetical protein PsYK624_008820 [Phanerochaete sordida]|uniref:Uncharacterized protein n=1 Tax=Phanerochaete sordida TaxID=48140 RepID=A0A9P3L789_9APHY|nr:hypothetical protein PsYK624_008820 [Phanerochaete sordida]